MKTKDFTVNISVNSDYPLQDFLNLPEVPCQRNTEARLGRARKYLSKTRPEHCIVHLVRLTKNCEVAGKLYSKGMMFRNDGNTRALNWEKQGSDYLPEKLVAIIYDYEDLDQIKEAYDCFDSAEATEKNQQKIYGILTGFYDYSPKSDKLLNGQIISGMNKACHFAKPTEWNQSTIKTSEQLRDQLSYWMINGCLQALDELMNKKEAWNQPFIAAALLSLRHYGTKNQKLLHGWKLIEQGAGNTYSADWDGITHITEEWKTGTFFKDVTICRDSRWDNMDRTVSYILYWIDKYMNDETGTKVGRGWEKVAKEYRHRTKLSELDL
jgi:hypothetical protein